MVFFPLCSAFCIRFFEKLSRVVLQNALIKKELDAIPGQANDQPLFSMHNEYSVLFWVFPEFKFWNEKTSLRLDS